LALSGKKIDPLRGFQVLHQGEQVLDCFSHLMGLGNTDFTIDEVGRASIGDESESKQQDEYGHEAHPNLLL
jgi:hypothetical protein